jgi:hypothetical protein
LTGASAIAELRAHRTVGGPMRPATGAPEDSVSEDVRIEVERPVRADVAALLREARAMMAGLYPPERCHGLELSS